MRRSLLPSLKRVQALAVLSLHKVAASCELSDLRLQLFCQQERVPFEDGLIGGERVIIFVLAIVSHFALDHSEQRP